MGIHINEYAKNELIGYMDIVYIYALAFLFFIDMVIRMLTYYKPTMNLINIRVCSYVRARV